MAGDGGDYCICMAGGFKPGQAQEYWLLVVSRQQCAVDRMGSRVKSVGIDRVASRASGDEYSRGGQDR